MSNTVQYTSNTADTSRGASSAIWASCPIEDILAGVKDGYHFFDDFLSGPLVAAGSEAATGLYRGFGDTASTGANGDEIGGTLVFTGTTQDKACGFRTPTAPWQISRSHGKLWFEARVKSSTIADAKHGIFLGLMEDTAITTAVPIISSSGTQSLADKNFVGFHRLSADGDMFDTVYKADGVTQVTVGSDAVTIAADTYVKLGMVFDPATYVLTFYKNGVKLADTKTIPSAVGTDFPNDVRLGLIFATSLATGTTPGSAEIDWWRCAQLSV